MTREEYEQLRHDAATRNIGDQYGYYMEMMGVDFDYIKSLEASIAEIIRIAGETLAYFIDCPHEVDDWNHPTHDCEKCDSCNADSCFCWETWLKELLIKEREEK